MNTFTTSLSNHCSRPTPTSGLFRILSRLRESIRHRYETRAMHHELACLDERILRDIGLTRDDLTRSLDIVAAERRQSMDRAACHVMQRGSRS